MNTTIETAEERRARIHAGALASFESGVRYHFDNPPETWSVRKVDTRRWYLVNAAGDMQMSFPRKRDADTALEMSLSSEMRGQSLAGRIWLERDAWYRGTSNDPRDRELTYEERDIVAHVLAEGGEYVCGECYKPALVGADGRPSDTVAHQPMCSACLSDYLAEADPHDEDGNRLTPPVGVESYELKGAGLFNLRSLSTGTLLQLYDVVHVESKAETDLFSMLRRILIERGALS